MSRAEYTDESEVLREIVRDWFRIKRIEALGRDQVVDPIRAIYERVISQQIAPLLGAISQIKSMLASGQRPAANSAQRPLPAGSPDIVEALAGIRSLIEQANNGVSESSTAQLSKLSEISHSQKALHTIGSETFASTWSISDFLIRYLVEARLQKVLDIEETLGLPRNLRLPKAIITTELFADLQSDDSSVF
jgi:hypothetical protein